MKGIPLELKRKFSLCEVLDLVQQSIYDPLNKIILVMCIWTRVSKEDTTFI